MIVVAFVYLFRITYVWTRGRARLRDQERRDAWHSLRIRVLVFVCPRTFVWERLSTVVPLVLRVYLFCVVSRSVRASRVTGAVSVARCMNSPAPRARGRRALM